MNSVPNVSDVEVSSAIRYLDPDWDNAQILAVISYLDPDLPEEEKTIKAAPISTTQWIKVAVTMLVCGVVIFCIAAMNY